ncbi:MAG: cation:proton antiporter [bacterium]|nr:cation:proton antiporter [bacterium]
MNILILLGLTFIFSFLGGLGANRLKAPKILGYVVIGLILGPSFLNWYNTDVSANLNLVTNITLGFIGLSIGGELKWDIIKRLGKGIIWITIFESFGAFLLVLLGSYIISRNLPLSIILGSLASATAPAGTVEVLKEYKAKGPLTSALYAVVGFDDAVALLIFGFSLPVATVLIRHTIGRDVWIALLMPFKEIFLSIVIGIAFGFLIAKILKLIKYETDMLIITISAIFISCGLAQMFDLSYILVNMVMGITITNLEKFNSNRLFLSTQNFTPPIYILFFILVGTRLDISLLPQMGIIGLVYIILRSVGKYFGVLLGGTVTKVEPVIKKYLGFGLMSQAGVAIGLAISAYHHLYDLGPEAREFGITIINLITATTFVVLIVGPIFVKYAIKKSGEIRVQEEK